MSTSTAQDPATTHSTINARTRLPPTAATARLAQGARRSFGHQPARGRPRQDPHESTGYGRNRALADIITKASGARAQVLTLAQVLAAYEDATHVGSWRNVNDGTRRYLEFIAANGYTLAAVERRACGQEPLPDAA